LLFSSCSVFTFFLHAFSPFFLSSIAFNFYKILRYCYLNPINYYYTGAHGGVVGWLRHYATSR
jgi:hypothetical protein